MTTPTRDSDDGMGGAPSVHVVLATHSREVKTALFHSLHAIPTITIVATGASTAELVNYTHAFRPDVVIVETGLPGLPLNDVLVELGTTHPALRVLLIGENTEMKTYPILPIVDVFADLDLLIAAIPGEGADAQ